MDRNNLNKTLVEALVKAGKTIMHTFDGNPGVTIKENQSSIVTEADIASEKTIIDILLRDFPNHNVISEEIGLIDHGSEFTWIIDPLDGTSNYTAGLPWFGVLIALFEGTSPTLAGAYLPVWQDLYTATAGMGSFKNGKRIYTTPNTNLKETLVTFSTDYSEDEDIITKELTIVRKLIASSRNLRNTNSLVDMLYMAEGKLGACVNMFTRIWDIAAPWLIVREAGGFMTDLEGSEIRFNLSAEAHRINYPVVLGAPGLKDQMLDIVTNTMA